MNWKDIKIDGIDQIEKCIGEFEITALDFFENLYEGDILHYGSFKVKIYEGQNNAEFTGFTNLRLIDSLGLGGYEGGTGFGTTIEQALEDTIQNFMNNLTEYNKTKKSGLTKEDFVLVSYDEF